MRTPSPIEPRGRRLGPWTAVAVVLTEEDLLRGFERLFKTCDAEKHGKLGYAQLRAGLEKSFTR